MTAEIPKTWGQLPPELSIKQRRLKLLIELLRLAKGWANGKHLLAWGWHAVRLPPYPGLLRFPVTTRIHRDASAGVLKFHTNRTYKVMINTVSSLLIPPTYLSTHPPTRLSTYPHTHPTANGNQCCVGPWNYISSKQDTRFGILNFLQKMGIWRSQEY